MKRLLLGIVGILLTGNVLASDLKVGDKMPVLSQEKYTTSLRNGLDDQDNFKGPILLFDRDGDGVSHFSQIYIHCGKKIDWGKPFAIYDFKKELIYIDNNPLDGYIDRIRTEKEKGDENLFTDAPSCTLNI